MASEKKTLEGLAAALRDLVAWFGKTETPGIIIGGVAASILGRARLTRDIDALVLVPEDSWPAFLEGGQKEGFAPRIPDALEFAGQARVLLLNHALSGIPVDISFGMLPFEEEAVAQAESIDILGISTPVPTPEDLIVMKSLAGRPHDWADIEGILAAHPSLDFARIRSWVRRICEAMAESDSYEVLCRVLAKHSKETKRRRKKK